MLPVGSENLRVRSSDLDRIANLQKRCTVWCIAFVGVKNLGKPEAAHPHDAEDNDDDCHDDMGTFDVHEAITATSTIMPLHLELFDNAFSRDADTMFVGDIIRMT